MGDFAAGRLDAETFQMPYLATWRDMRDKGEPWIGDIGKLLAAIFDSTECFSPDFASGELTDDFALDEPHFRAELLTIHGKLHALQ